MAKETLPANFKDDILASEMGGKRRYKITFPDGTEQEVMLEDVTNYDQVGSNFGAAQVNQINTAINESLGKTDDASNVINTFSAAGTRTNLTSKEKLSVSLGKIMKWFSDLKNGAFHNVANNLTTSDANYVLDARQGKTLNDAKLDKTGNASNVTNTFTQATARNQLTSGEKLSVSLGKIMKFFADLKSGAYSTVVNNGTTTVANTVLDGRMGKTLLDKINDLLTKYNTLNSALANKHTFVNAELKYINDGQESYAEYTPPTGYVAISAQLINAPAGYFGIKLIKLASTGNKITVCLNWGYSGNWSTRIYLIKI